MVSSNHDRPGFYSKVVTFLQEKTANSHDLCSDIARLVATAEVHDVESVDIMLDEILLPNRAQEVAIEGENRLPGTSLDYVRDLFKELEYGTLRIGIVTGTQSSVFGKNISCIQSILQQVELTRFPAVDLRSATEPWQANGMPVADDLNDVTVTEILLQVRTIDRKCLSTRRGRRSRCRGCCHSPLVDL
jgi:hypothetical protein